MTSDRLWLLQDLRRWLLEPPRQLRPRMVTATSQMINPRLSEPPRNLPMKRSHACRLHRFQEATSNDLAAAIDQALRIPAVSLTRHA